MLDEGFWAEIKVGGEHLRLFSERNALGVQTSVYNVNTKSWIAPSETVDDIEQGKEKAAAYAEAHLTGLKLIERLPNEPWSSMPRSTKRTRPPWGVHGEVSSKNSLTGPTLLSRWEKRGRGGTEDETVKTP
jgi:hypothetical protein